MVSYSEICNNFVHAKIKAHQPTASDKDAHLPGADPYQNFTRTTIYRTKPQISVVQHMFTNLILQAGALLGETTK